MISKPTAARAAQPASQDLRVPDDSMTPTTGSRSTTHRRWPTYPRDRRLQKNPDGSVDLCVGPKTPVDWESDWIEPCPTRRGSRTSTSMDRTRRTSNAHTRYRTSNRYEVNELRRAHRQPLRLGAADGIRARVPRVSARIVASAWDLVRSGQGSKGRRQCQPVVAILRVDPTSRRRQCAVVRIGLVHEGL